MADRLERHPLAQAEHVIADRISGGSLVLGIEEPWVARSEIRPDVNHIADFSPDGLQGPGEITKVLQSLQ